MPLKLAHPYPVTVDPTRTAEHLRFLKLADASELEMHHMSLVRDFPRGIIAKLDNVSNKANYFATSTTDRAEGVRTFLKAFAKFNGENDQVSSFRRWPAPHPCACSNCLKSSRVDSQIIAFIRSDRNIRIRITTVCSTELELFQTCLKLKSRAFEGC